MAETFNLPAVGDTMVEGEIIEWFVSVGEAVELDQPICSVETDKSVVEMTTPHRGTVLALGGKPGDVIEVGSPLIVVGEPGEHVPESAGSESGNAPTSPLVRKLAADLGVDVATVSGSGLGGRITRADVEAAATGLSGVPAEPAPADDRASDSAVMAMPKVRREARARGIDLSLVEGNGPGGSITLDDLDVPAARGERRQRLSATRRSIARHLTESAQTIPQFTSMVEVDATAVLATRAALRDRLDTAVPIDAVFVALLIPVLRDHPMMNARLDGEEIVYHDHYDIGIAVDTPDGLMLPVVGAADRRPIEDLASEVVRLATSARDRTIRPDELSGATCTVNNVGALGVVAGTPILPLGTSTIVAFGAARPVVQLRNGNPVEVPTITVCATFDHRLVDGGDSGRFLAQLKQHLEVPALGLL